jgi:hypothetical protein
MRASVWCSETAAGAVLVDLATGGETVLTRRPRSAATPRCPDGRHVVAEQVVGRTTDLYLVEVP